MAHHPFPARLRIPTQNVGTGGIRGGPADGQGGFVPFFRAPRPPTTLLQRGKRVPPARNIPPARSDAPCPTVGPTPRYAVPDGYRTPSPPRKQDALPSSSHLLYPFGSGTAGTSAPSFRPRLFCSVRLPMRFPATTNSADRPRTPTGLLRLSARGTVPDGSTAKVSESAGAPLQTAARPRQPKRSATRWTR